MTRIAEIEWDLDTMVAEEALRVAQAHLDAGASIDDLPVLMADFVASARAMREYTLLRLRAMAEAAEAVVH